MLQDVPPETVALVRRRYAAGDPVADILRDTGLSNGILYKCLDGRFDDGSGAPLPLRAIPRRRAGLRIMRSPTRRKALVARIWRNAEAQVEQIETRLAQSGLAPDVFERDARSLAILVRTLRELSAFDAKRKPDEAKKSKSVTIPCPETSTNCDESLRERWMRLSRIGRKVGENLHWTILAALPRKDLVDLIGDWKTFSLPHQRPPEFAGCGEPWTTWLLMGGRGAGKTLAGAQWVNSIANADPPVSPIALVGETEHDVREVMIEGVSGVLRPSAGHLRPTWIPSRRRLEWPSGAVAQAFSAEDPESLRGPQFAAAWCDELAKWRHAEATFDMLQFGLRLGERPRQVITTTPRPIALLKRLVKDPKTAVTRAATIVNARNLAPAFFDAVITRYHGTRLGRQELDGEIIEERADALWTRHLIESCRVAQAPPLSRIVVAVDPPASSGKGADACGLVAAGLAENGMLYVIADETAAGLTPAGWSRRAIALWRRLQADALVVEVNQGGDMVKAVIGEADNTVPVVSVRAKKGKWLRAEPVAALYEQGRVKHAGTFAALEDEMCDFGLDGLSSGRSPDRLDAMVWAVTALSFGARGEPRVRGL